MPSKNGFFKGRLLERVGLSSRLPGEGRLCTPEGSAGQGAWRRARPSRSWRGAARRATRECTALESCATTARQSKKAHDALVRLDSRTFRADPCFMRKWSAHAALCAAGLWIVAAPGCRREAGKVRYAARTPQVRILSESVGGGTQAEAGRTVTARTVVRLPDGEVILDSGKRGAPDSWEVGGGGVIAGMDQAVMGMRAGGTRTVEIPPELHWGRAGYGGVVPANTKILVDIELLNVR